MVSGNIKSGVKIFNVTGSLVASGTSYTQLGTQSLTGNYVDDVTIGDNTSPVRGYSSGQTINVTYSAPIKKVVIVAHTYAATSTTSNSYTYTSYIIPDTLISIGYSSGDIITFTLSLSGRNVSRLAGLDKGSASVTFSSDLKTFTYKFTSNVTQGYDCTKYPHMTLTFYTR